jgi:glutamine synthetase
MVMQNENSTLNELLVQFKNMNLIPVIGAELEFYLFPLNEAEYNESWQAEELKLDIYIEQEKGRNQFEVKTGFSKDIYKQIDEINSLRGQIAKQSLKQKMHSSFKARPLADQPGSALHIHLHLEDLAGNNLYMKKNANDESDITLYSLGGLCSTMLEDLHVFAPYEEAYLRYKGDSIESPCKVCWGGNNRSAAIRLPLAEKENRRLEHRVPCADSDPLEVIIAILSGVLLGIKNKILPPEKLYGNAFLEQYEYPWLTK